MERESIFEASDIILDFINSLYETLCRVVFRSVLSQPGDDVEEHALGVGLRNGGGVVWELVLGDDFGHGKVVVSDQCVLGERGVTHGHVDAAVAQELHDGNEAHARVEELGGVGMAQAMGDDGAGDVEAEADRLQRFSHMVFDRYSAEVRGEEERAIDGADFLQSLEELTGFVAKRNAAVVV